jgi:hypothetical protein
MQLNTLAKLSLIGLIYIYASRLIDTLYHGIFSPTAFAAVIVGLNILAGMALFAFFISFYRYIGKKTGKILQFASILAIAGSAIGLLPKFYALAVLFQHESLFFFLRYGRQIKVFCPWFSACLLLSFSIIFVLNPYIRRDQVLKNAFCAGLVGWLIMFSALSLVLINYLHQKKLIWLVDFSEYGLAIFLVTSSATFLCLLMYFKSFINADFSNKAVLPVK